MDTEYENSRVERTKRGLYSPDAKVSSGHFSDLPPSGVHVDDDWGDTKIVSARDLPQSKAGAKVLKSIIALAVLTVFSSGGYLLYQLFSGEKPSDKNIEISFDVPVGTTPGIPADLVVRIANKNRVGLEYANLSLLYPSGTRIGDSPNNDLSAEKKSFGVVAPGQIVEYHTKAIFLGEENTDKEIRALIEYRFQNINSVFTKEETRQVHLLASPINLTVDTLKEINAGQTIEFNVSTLSNTVIPLRDVFIKVEYPLGFTFADADPKPTFGNNIWRVGVVNPTGKFSVKIRGVLAGEDTEERVFHTSVGVGSDRTERDISTVYSTVLSAITLKRPFIGINLLFGDRPAEQSVAHFGERIGGRVTWRNNLSTKIVNAQIEIRLRGVALDRSSVSAGNSGFYRSLDDTILWDERGDPRLAVMEAGDSGEEAFGFFPLPSVTGNQLLINPTIIADVTVRGKRISESGVPEEIKTVITQNIKVTSQAQFAARAVYYVGPFVNTGPIPPKVEQETSYTVIWSIVNTSNNLNNAEVRGILPPYINWAGAVSPGAEPITFDRNTNQVIWSPGSIPAGTGVGKPPREVAFQVVLTPSLTQVKITPFLMKNITFSATDVFTGEVFHVTKNEISTALSTDPKAKLGDGAVVP
jgi:hypothetical protein